MLGLLLVATLAQSPLQQAQAAFAAGEYARAESLALAAAAPPQEGAALYLAALASFREGHPAEALELLDRAARAPDAPEPGAWHFNRGACLSELGRFDEAAAEFSAAAGSPALAPVAWLSAGWAALDAGDAPAAQRHAAAARDAGGDPPPRGLGELLARLDEAAQDVRLAEVRGTYDAALALFDAGALQSARQGFLDTAARAGLFPVERARATLMGGAAAWRLGLYSEAEAEVAAALGQPLTEMEQQVARGYLERIRGGLRGLRPGWQWSAGAGTGLDTNVQQSGVAQRDAFVATAARQGSAFVDLQLLGAWRSLAVGPWVFDASWSSTQRAYVGGAPRPLPRGMRGADPSLGAEDYSLQSHRLLVQAEAEFGALRAGSSVQGEFMFTGLSAFRPLQGAAGLSAWGTWTPRPETNTVLQLSAGPRQGVGDGFAYLSGTRYEALVQQAFRRGPWNAAAWVRYRDERIGTLEQAASSFPTEPCAGGCTSARYVIPFAWAGPAAGLDVRFRPIDALTLRLDADVEARRYGAAGYLAVQDAAGTQWRVGERTREDVRVGGAASLSWRPAAAWELAARYDGLVNVSNVDSRLDNPAGACATASPECHAWDATDANYVKHVLSVSALLAW